MDLRLKAEPEGLFQACAIIVREAECLCVCLSDRGLHVITKGCESSGLSNLMVEMKDIKLWNTMSDQLKVELTKNVM